MDAWDSKSDFLIFHLSLKSQQTLYSEVKNLRKENFEISNKILKTQIV
jgi:hypothetical protein